MTWLQHTAKQGNAHCNAQCNAHCNTLQHTATHTATYCNTMQHAATHILSHRVLGGQCKPLKSAKGCDEWWRGSHQNTHIYYRWAKIHIFTIGGQYQLLRSAHGNHKGHGSHTHIYYRRAITNTHMHSRLVMPTVLERAWPWSMTWLPVGARRRWEAEWFWHIHSMIQSTASLLAVTVSS